MVINYLVLTMTMSFLASILFFSTNFAGKNKVISKLYEEAFFYKIVLLISQLKTDSAVFTVCSREDEIQHQPSGLQSKKCHMKPEYSTQTWMEALPHIKCLEMPSHAILESRDFFIVKIFPLSFRREEKTQPMKHCCCMGHLCDKRIKKENLKKNPKPCCLVRPNFLL